VHVSIGQPLYTVPVRPLIHRRRPHPPDLDA
jgi:hypothetical protein